MVNNPNFDVLDAIEKIHNASAASELKPEPLEKVKSETELLSNYLGVEPISAVIFASAFVMSNEMTNMIRLFTHFGGNEYMLFLKHRKHIEPLYAQQLLRSTMPLAPDIKTFKLASYVEDCVTQNNYLIDIELRNEKPKAFLDVVQQLSKIYDGYMDDDNMIFYDIDDIVLNIINENQHLPFFQQLKEWKLYEYEIYFLTYIIRDAIHNGNNKYNTVIVNAAEGYFKNKSKAVNFLDIILDGESNLITLGLIEVRKEGFKEHTRAKLSKRILKLLKETENIQLDYSGENNVKLINPEKIKTKNLFYNPSEVKHVETLKEVLSKENFMKVQERLEEKAMPTGFTILLHGDPGTGKTESVLQIAKETGRTIFKVEISEAKVKWYGESERQVKKIFTDYNELKKEEPLCPILMFNEADALINKRKSYEQYADKTDNAIQNIFLEELENFDGILMATTNLVENLEKAFERRFLYKVKFEKPGIENAAKIWRDKIPFLTEDETLKLAGQFDFSGGEIENIARKCMMTEILHNIAPDFEQVKNLCNEERWSDDGKMKIGF